MSDLLCPLDCGEPLHLIWSLAQPINVADDDGSSVEPARTPTPNTQSWRVECEAGHVLLLPDRTGCPDGEVYQTITGAVICAAAPCPHDDDHDWSDDYRSFRTADAARLTALCRRSGGAS